jgi:hypothetical protein
MKYLKHLFWASLLASNLGATSIADGVFNPANWTATLIQDIGSSSTSSTNIQILTGGNPGEYRYNEHSMTGNADYTAFNEANLYNAQTLNQPFTQIDFSWDLRLLIPANDFYRAVAYRPLLQQNGNFYTTVAFTAASDNNNWQHNSMNGLTQSLFCRVLANDLNFDCAQNPNFSAGGFTAGYLVGNSFSGNGATGNYYSAIDNFAVSTDAVPEPATMAVLGISLGVLAAARRRLQTRN